MSPYRILPHTSDLKILVTAPTLMRLYGEALEALFDCLLNRDSIRELERRTVQVAADQPDLVLKDLLDEGLHQFEVTAFAVRSAEVARLDRHGLEVILRGEPYDTDRHETRMVIKAVTYHGLEVRRWDDGWCAEVVLDL